LLTIFGNATSAFGFPTKEETAREIDEYISKNDDVEYIKKDFAGLECFLAGERADVSVISDDSIDHDGESIDYKTFNWEEFRKNPLVAFGHNYDIPPIGRSLWQKNVANVWKAKTQYADRPAEYPEGKEWFPDTIFHLIKSGFLPGKSIGALTKVRIPTPEDIAANPILKSAKRIRYDVKVFEYSVVTKNCNKNAIVEAVAKGTVSLSEEILNHHFSDVAQGIIDAKKSILPENITLKSVTYVKKQEDAIKQFMTDLEKKTPELVDNCLAKILGRV
jgi:hypothetical protein